MDTKHLNIERMKEELKADSRKLNASKY